MENCLVTKLKGTVDNPNLPKLNQGVIHVTEVTQEQWEKYNNYVSFGSNTEAVVVDIVGDGTFYDNIERTEVLGKHVEVPAGTTKTLWISNGTYNIVYSAKYTMMYFEAFSWGIRIPTEDIKYMPNLVKLIDLNSYVGVIPRLTNLTDITKIHGADIKATQVEIPLANVIGSSLALVEADGVPISGDLSLLTTENFPSLGIFVGGTAGSSLLHGRIDDVTANLTRFMPNGNADITGTIEGFVAKQRVHRPVYNYTHDGDKNLRFLNSSITFQGEPIPNGNVELSWTENTITFEGATINA